MLRPPDVNATSGGRGHKCMASEAAVVYLEHEFIHKCVLFWHFDVAFSRQSKLE